MNQSLLPKLIVLLGPTAAGKTDWSIRLAKEFGGEIVGADSRQIYTKMNIGTAKPEGEWKRRGLKKVYEVDGVPYNMVDLIDPGKTFSVAEFHDKGIAAVRQIIKAKKIPLLVGGTGLYISSLVDNLSIPRIEPNKKLRQSLEEKSLDELVALLETMDPDATKTIDIKNKRRLLRALEVCILSGEPFSKQQGKGKPLFDVLQIGVSVPRDLLYSRIDSRVDQMMADGLLEEVSKLMKQRYAWHLPSMSGVGYRQFQDYFAGTKDLAECVSLLKRDTRHFARRQMTWFRRDNRIVWCSSYDEAKQQVQDFLQ